MFSVHPEKLEFLREWLFCRKILNFVKNKKTCFFSLFIINKIENKGLKTLKNKTVEWLKPPNFGMPNRGPTAHMS